MIENREKEREKEKWERECVCMWEREWVSERIRDGEERQREKEKGRIEGGSERGRN